MENSNSIAGKRLSQNVHVGPSEKGVNVGSLSEGEVNQKASGTLSPARELSSPVDQTPIVNRAASQSTAAIVPSAKEMEGKNSAKEMEGKKFPAAWVEAVTTVLKQATQQAAAQCPSDPVAYEEAAVTFFVAEAHETLSALRYQDTDGNSQPLTPEMKKQILVAAQNDVLRAGGQSVAEFGEQAYAITETAIHLLGSAARHQGLDRSLEQLKSQLHTMTQATIKEADGVPSSISSQTYKAIERSNKLLVALQGASNANRTRSLPEITAILEALVEGTSISSTQVRTFTGRLAILLQDPSKIEQHELGTLNTTFKDLINGAKAGLDGHIKDLEGLIQSGPQAHEAAGKFRKIFAGMIALGAFVSVAAAATGIVLGGLALAGATFPLWAVLVPIGIAGGAALLTMAAVKGHASARQNENKTLSADMIKDLGAQLAALKKMLQALEV